MSDMLARICADKLIHVAECKERVPLEQLKATIKTGDYRSSFIKKLRENPGKAVIAEIKKASPSKGIIRADFDPVQIARIYENCGASCLSVLTDAPYFQGQDAYLEQVRAAVDLPLLRKDFMLDTYQVYEARTLGADCILIIMAALSDENALSLYETATELGMDTLFEVHDRRELDRALNLSPQMIGVNSRNLKTLAIDLRTALDLISHIPENLCKIAESGINTHSDLSSLSDAGYDAFLIGESFMREVDISAAYRAITA